MTSDVKHDRQQFYQHISGQNLTPLWESLHHLVPKTPNANCAPAYWNYQEIRPLLLESGTLPLKTIASQCGYSSSDVLRRAFIKRVGITPSMYRRLNMARPWSE